MFRRERHPRRLRHEPHPQLRHLLAVLSNADHDLPQLHFFDQAADARRQRVHLVLVDEPAAIFSWK